MSAGRLAVKDSRSRRRAGRWSQNSLVLVSLALGAAGVAAMGVCAAADLGGVAAPLRGEEPAAATAASRRLLQSVVTASPVETPAPNVTDSSSGSDFAYPQVFFTYEQMQRGAFLICLAGVVYMFAGLAIVCDDYFVPALEIIVDTLGLSEDVAGATFMAAGGSAPELFTSFVGVFVAKSNVGFGTIVGSAVFNILFVIGICAVATRDMDPLGLPLTWWPLFRDASFYSLALLLLALFFSDKEIRWYESLSLLVLYGCYVSFMKFNESAKKRAWQLTGLNWDDLSAEMVKSDCLAKGDTEMQHVSAIRENTSNEEDDDDDDDAELWTPHVPTGTVKEKIVYVILFPLNFVLWATLPNCQREEKQKYYVMGFLGSIMWIAIFAYFMVWWAEVSSRALHVPSTVMGLTVLAAGTSVPDLITSVIVAKKGYGDMAVSSSIGSNMFDVTLGLPLPWFLWSVFYQEPIEVSSSSLLMSVVMLFIMLFVTIGCIAAFGWRLNKLLGITSMLLYIVFVTVFLLIEYEVF